jgi:hypothetical protein
MVLFATALLLLLPPLPAAYVGVDFQSADVQSADSQSFNADFVDFGAAFNTVFAGAAAFSATTFAAAPFDGAFTATPFTSTPFLWHCCTRTRTRGRGDRRTRFLVSRALTQALW